MLMLAASSSKKLAINIRHKVELLVTGMPEKSLGRTVEAESQPGVATPLQYPLVHGKDQRSALGSAPDLDKFPRLDIHRIVHQDASYCFNAWVCHILLLQTE